MDFYDNIYDAWQALIERMENNSYRFPEFYDEEGFRKYSLRLLPERAGLNGAREYGVPKDLSTYWEIIPRFTYDYYTVTDWGQIVYNGSNGAVQRFAELWNVGRREDATLILGMSGISQERLDSHDSQAVYYKVMELTEPARSQKILDFARSMIPQLTERRNTEIFRALDDGLSQAEIARDCGLTRAAINQIVKG